MQTTIYKSSKKAIRINAARARVFEGSQVAVGGQSVAVVESWKVSPPRFEYSFLAKYVDEGSHSVE